MRKRVKKCNFFHSPFHRISRCRKCDFSQRNSAIYWDKGDAKKVKTLKQNQKKWRTKWILIEIVDVKLAHKSHKKFKKWFNFWRREKLRNQIVNKFSEMTKKVNFKGRIELKIGKLKGSRPGRSLKTCRYPIREENRSADQARKARRTSTKALNNVKLHLVNFRVCVPLRLLNLFPLFNDNWLWSAIINRVFFVKLVKIDRFLTKFGLEIPRN